VGRLRWFMAGAGVAAGTLVAAPGAYQRLRTLVQPAHRPALPMPRDEQPAPPREPAPAAAFAAYDPPAAEDDDTTELRLRIDETRDRIRRRAVFGEPEGGGAPPEGDAPPQAG
jgi:hypothetical protein